MIILPIPIFNNSSSPNSNGKYGCLIPILALLFYSIIIWAGLTLLMWLMPFEGNPTLLEVLKDQWKWISSKRIF